MSIQQALSRASSATSAYCHPNDRRTRASFAAFVLGFLFVHALTGCGGGSSGQSAMPVPPPTVQSSVTQPVATPESGDAWQGRYVGTVTIGGLQYFGDALLTADGLIRLYVGGPYDGGG